MDKSLPAGPQHETRPSAVRSLFHGLERLKARRALRAARWEADTELAHRTTAALRLAWRVEELVSTKNRLDLAHALRSLVREANVLYLPGPSPVNRVAVRAEADAILAIAERVADLDRPVGPRGVVLSDRLLTDGSGPLYDRERVDELPAYLDSTLDALEPDTR
jgi:hypothetical protein